MKITLPSIAVTTSLALSQPLSAIELGQSAELHGFINQAYLYSPDNPYAGTDSLDGSLNFREIGVNGFVEISPDLRFAGQLISRRQDEADDGDLRVDFLLADYILFSDMTTTAGVRAGRVKNNVGFYNATRDIPSARPGFNVPSSIYFDSFRDTLLSADGINLYGSFLFYDNQLSWDLVAGETGIESENFEYYLYGLPAGQGAFEEVPIWGINVNLVPAFDRSLRLGLSIVDLDVELDDPLSVPEAQLAAFLNPADVEQNPQNYLTGTDLDALFTIVSAQYSYNDWIVTAEYLNIFSELDLEIVGASQQFRTTTEAYYLQVEWLQSSAVSWFSRYEELYLDKNDQAGRKTALSYNQYRGFGKGWTVGGRWAFKPNWSMTGQASFNEGTAWLPNYNNIEDEEIEKYWNYYVIALTYQF